MELTQKQVTKGNNVTVFALNNQNRSSHLDHWNGIEIYRPRMMDFTSLLSLFSNQDISSWGPHFKFFADVVGYNLLSASEFVNILVREKKRTFDIIDGHDWLGILGAMIAKQELDIPLLFHVHSTEGGRSLGGGSETIKNIEFQGGQTADGIITVSHAMKQELQQLGFPSKSIRVCWNGVDPNKYNPQNIPPEDISNLRHRYGIKDNEIMLFFIGRLVTVKGVDKLVQAMPNILNEFPNTKLILLGLGDMENLIRNLINNLGIQNNVFLRNEFIDERERILHYAASDLVILPSLYEPFGIVCTEAMSMAKPVVVGARGTNGMQEQVIPKGEEQCGIHINPYSPDDIAWGVKQLLGSKEKRLHLGINGRERVKKYFSWDVAAKRTIEIYNEFIKN